jgi:hypothetical protein
MHAVRLLESQFLKERSVAVRVICPDPILTAGRQADSRRCCFTKVGGGASQQGEGDPSGRTRRGDARQVKQNSDFRPPIGFPNITEKLHFTGTP